MRHDEKYLKLLHDHGNHSFYNEIKELPFFYFVIPDEWKQSEYRIDLEKVKSVLPENFETSLNDLMPFPRFSFVLDKDPCLHVLENTKEHMKMIDIFKPSDYDHIRQSPQYTIEDYKLTRGLWSHIHTVKYKIEDAKFTQEAYNCDVLHFYKQKQKEYINIVPTGKEDFSTTLYAQNLQDFSNCWNVLIALLYVAEEKHQRLVHVAPAPQKKKKGLGISTSRSYTSDHHYVYLDGPPVTACTDSESKELIHRRGHHRRAHWHRLTHERFKNHPNYGQRIRIRATWVGPKEWVDQGKIYTLHDRRNLLD